MTYIDLINNFWRMHGSQEFGPNEIALYFYLLNECNRQGWPSPLVRPNSKICLGLGMSENTLMRCRNNLKMRGVLDFESGKKSRKAPAYYLKNCGSRGGSGGGSDSGSREGTGGGIYKTIRQEEKKTKEKSVVVDACVSEEFFSELFFDDSNAGFHQTLVDELHRVNPATATIADFRRMAEAVLTEWRLSGKKHVDYRDWVNHLLSQIRVKNRDVARVAARQAHNVQPEINPFDEYRRKLMGGL
ncbi:MAG: hypothetical protein NC130_10730 [Lachnoclostridium sp.]|nr:hypothetical protein [Lachnoclostridium sp.]